MKLMSTKGGEMALKLFILYYGSFEVKLLLCYIQCSDLL